MNLVGSGPVRDLEVPPEGAWGRAPASAERTALFVGALACVAAAGLRAAVPERAPRTPVEPPSLHALSLSTLDHPTVAATAWWIVVVVDFDRAMASGGDAAGLAAAVGGIATLDPTWQVPWVYGSLMARALGDLPASHALLRGAMAAHPMEPWFPATLGTSLHQDLGDDAGAARWLAHAASLPGSPDVHAAAAAAFARRASEARP